MRGLREAVLATTILLASPAAGQEDSRWVRKGASCDLFGCRPIYRRVPIYHAPRHITLEYGVRSPECKPTMKAVGVEKYSPDEAREAADQTLRELIRFHWGVKYMDLRNARRLTYLCGQSSTGGRKSEKAAAIAGGVLHQCEVEAIPCLSDKERGDNR